MWQRSSGSLRGAKSNRGLLTRGKRVSLAVQAAKWGNDAALPSATIVLPAGRAVKGQSWLSCVPTMQASVESHVSKGAKRGAAGKLSTNNSHPQGIAPNTVPHVPALHVPPPPLVPNNAFCFPKINAPCDPQGWISGLEEKLYCS